MKTIAYQSSLDWFSSRKTRGKYSSPKEALREHIQYILRPKECALSHNLDLKDWLRRADSYLSQRRDARIAGKRIFALPNNLSPGAGLELLKEFLTSKELFSIRQNGKRVKVKLKEDDFGIAIHDSKGISGEKNLHAHVVFAPKTRKGDKEYSLNLTKAELKGLYREWEKFLKEKGYSLKRSPVRGEPHYGPQRLRFDRRARASYFHLSRAKNLWRQAIEEEQLERMLESITQTQGSDLLTWSEIQEDEERSSKPTQGREKSESPPPRPRPQKPVKQVKPVVNKVKPVPPRQPQQPRISVLSQRPSQVQHTELEQKTKDPVKQIREHVERELAQKKRREQQLAQEVNYSLKQQARELSRSESPSPGRPASYPLKKSQRMEVGNVINPYVTQEVVEERQEVQRKIEIYQAEMTITYRFRYLQGKLTFRFRTLSSWSPEQRKGVAAFLASVAVAVLYGFEYPREALEFYGKFVEKEAVSVEEQVKRVIKKPFYSSPEEALKALSIKKTIHVRVRIFEGGKLVEEHNFFLTRESFTIMERYAEAVRRRRPQPPGQGQGQPPQPQQPGYQDDEEEPDWPEPGM